MTKKSPAWRKYERDLVIYNHVETGVSAEKHGEISDAIAAFEKAAIMGSIYARNRLGTIFSDVIKPHQPSRAVYWYKAGVRLGDCSSAWDLAMHYSGLGNKRWYRHWLTVAKRMGEIDAAEELKTGKWWRKHNDLP